MSRIMDGGASRAVLVAGIIALLGAAACATVPEASTQPPRAQLLELSGYRIRIPPGGGWEVDEFPSGRVVFTKRWGGFLRWMVGDQRRMRIEVAPLQVPREMWALTGDDLIQWIQDESRLQVGRLDPRLEWRAFERGDKVLYLLRSAWDIDADYRSTGLDSLSDEVSYEESLCLGVLLPADLLKNHRYFRIILQTTFIVNFASQKSRDIELLAAIMDGLEVPGPYEDVSGPFGVLLRSAVKGDPEEALRAVEEGADLDGRTDDGSTALLIAIDFGHVEVVRRLLAHGADVDVRNDGGWSPLLIAVLRGEASLVDELVARGADVDANIYATGETALLLALQKDDPGIAGRLIEAGADVNRHKDGAWTPLMAAAAKGWSDLVVLLLEKGADVNVRSDDGQTVLKLAENGGWTALVEILIRAGAKR